MPAIFAAIAAGTMVVDQIQIELHNYGNVSDDALKSFFVGADAARMRISTKSATNGAAKVSSASSIPLSANRSCEKRMPELFAQLKRHNRKDWIDFHI
jgi:hypothetical protein